MTLKTIGKADIWWVSYHFSSTRAPITSNTLHKFITTMYTGVSNMQNRCMNVVTISRKKNTYELSLRTVHALTRVWTVSQSNTRFFMFLDLINTILPSFDFCGDTIVIPKFMWIVNAYLSRLRLWYKGIDCAMTMK